jgi:hypothetical protein
LHSILSGQIVKSASLALSYEARPGVKDREILISIPHLRYQPERQDNVADGHSHQKGDQEDSALLHHQTHRHAFTDK